LADPFDRAGAHIGEPQRHRRRPVEHRHLAEIEPAERLDVTEHQHHRDEVDRGDQCTADQHHRERGRVGQ
jgi:hypothetical protein